MRFRIPISIRFVCLFVAVLAFCSSTSFLQGAESDWGFDSKAFDARLFQDWLRQDEPNDALRAELFGKVGGGKAEGALVGRVLSELEENDSESDSSFAYQSSVSIDASNSNGKIEFSKEALSKLRSRLERLIAAQTPGDDSKWRELYVDACLARRASRLEGVEESAPKFVYTKHYVIGASHYAYTEDVSDEAYLDFSHDRKPGGQLCLATFAPDGTIRNEVLVAVEDGTIRDPDVSWDGKKVLFSMRKSFTQDDFHIYEYDVETKQTRQITFGLGVADIEPIYLPNGDIFFTSTRCGQITDCWWTEVSNFYTCDDQGRFLRRVSVDQVTVNYPKLLNDGRIIYTRWDYNDRGQIFPQPLFQMNVDGTGQTEYYGNNSYFPTTIMHARGIPESDKVIAIASGHHSYQHGKLLLIDRSKGSQENQGATLIAPVRETPADRIDAYGQGGELFQYPYPLDETSLICAYLPEGRGDWYKIPFGLYWFDFDGRRELLTYDPAISCGQPIALVEREKPTTRPSQVDLNQATGKYYVQDVYEGPGLEGVERGTIKALRVVGLGFRGVGIRSNGNSGPAGGAMVCTPVAVNNGTWDVKYVLGTVPVEEDGSAYFEVPALTPSYFQLLDKNGDVVQTMRSWSTLQPGETFGCVGCHEPKGNVIENVSATGTTTSALRKGVARLAPELTPGKGAYQNAGFSFNRDVQPILDSYCVKCHTGGVNADGSAAPFSLLGNYDSSPKGNEISEKSGRTFSQSYLNLTNYGDHDGSRAKWIGIQEGPDMLPPYKTGAFASPLIKLFRDKDGKVGGQDANHKDVKIDEKSLRTLALWIDLLVPYCGDYTEENNWTKEERARYEYYMFKQANSARIVADNVEKLVATEKTGKTPDFERFEQLNFGGLEDREEFLKTYLERDRPSLARLSGEENVYRNVALNPKDVQRCNYEVALYPHASSNSEYAFADEFAAKNAIDGKKENKGHGPMFPSWGPNLRTDLYLNVEFGTEVEIDKCVIYLRADFPHDVAWKSGTLEFSDGSRVPISFKETDEPQTFNFAKRRVTSVKLTDLKSDEPTKWSGVAEIEFWGKSVEASVK